MSTKVLITLTASNKWYGKQIRKALKSNVNHGLILYRSRDWKDWRAVDTQEKGVTPAVSAKKLTRIDYAECWECDLDLWEGLRATKKDLYKKYDYVGLVFGVIRAVLSNYLGITFNKPIHAHNRLFCSEYIAVVFQGAKLAGTEKWIPANISPKDLQDYMIHDPHFKPVAVPAPVKDLYKD